MDAVPAPFDQEGLRELLDRRQHGVVSVSQLRGLHARPHDIKRMVRRRELVVVHPGAYVDHTGPLSWDQRAWAAVLVHWPAALSHRSALPTPPRGGSIHVAVGLRRTTRSIPGVVVHRTADFDDRVRWNADPPRISLEHVVIDLASSVIADPAAAFTVLADACQTRRTTPDAVARVLADRVRVAGRRLIEEMLDDLRTGACSVLEREWLRLERLHGLPVADRQVGSSAGGRLAYRDAVHGQFDVAVELDGKAFHDTAGARDADAERDLDAAVEDGLLTVRLTYGQVYGRGCATVHKMARLLQARGWDDEVVRCPSCP